MRMCPVIILYRIKPSVLNRSSTSTGLSSRAESSAPASNRRFSDRGRSADTAISTSDVLYSHAVISETQLFEHGAVVDVAQVKEVGGFEQLLDPLQVEVAELVPLGEDEHGIGPVHGLVLVGGKGHVVFHVLQAPGGLFHGLGVVGPEMGAGGGQVADNSDGRALAHIVGVGFEGQPQNGQGFSAQVAGSGAGGGEGAAHFIGHEVLLLFVALDSPLYQVLAGAGGLANFGQGAGVL